MMEESRCSEVVYIVYENRGTLVTALEQYLTRYAAIHTLPERAATLHMQEVILWTNDMVTVFTDEGQQMPYYQGRFGARYALINNVFHGGWHYGDWNRGIVSATAIQL